ncbi:bifunctional histidinol-phosphatase/imidazoleglycerol-phosphate dehydratase HisB [Legionella fairfieldensis]|uniref:bifunctional histidinol-phosphatase/imidazoleglycerol-phosphate dehydratase HisB n=1 Tax=Legionella fairfieldensis TaxID=45064 RepID=UPI00048C2EA8|nr:bifunctional histidinol-phosphatase/imidazoleglycerol-phosphate dehydratase HisB [Legionella fairfieldensis]
MSKQKILFIDRDGTLIDEPVDKQIDSLEKLELEPEVIPALLQLKSRGYRFVMLSNQDGLGSSRYPQAQFDRVQEKLLSLLSSQGITFDAIHICPHWESDECECRKPNLGLVLDYLAMPDLDRQRSYVIGDRETDCLLAKKMRLKGFLYHKKQNNWAAIVAQIENKNRVARLERKTSETMIEASVDLDKEQFLTIDTGLAFFDHMLEQLARHAGISLELKAVGDLEVDEHHLIEDTAIVLGEVLRQALGDKCGANRYGFLLPMDEAIVEVALDLSGRPYFVFEGDFSRERVGDLPTEMIAHFFQSLACSLKATLHLRMRGSNAHHQVECLFKGFARAFRQAKQCDGIGIPSTKGIL